MKYKTKLMKKEKKPMPQKKCNYLYIKNTDGKEGMKRIKVKAHPPKVQPQKEIPEDSKCMVMGCGKDTFVHYCEDCHVSLIEHLLSQAREDDRERIIAWVKSKKKYCTADHLGYHDKNCDGCQIWAEDLIKYLKI